MAAISAIRCNPDCHTFSARLTAWGKPHRVALVAVMCKLLGLLRALLRDGPPVDTRGPCCRVPGLRDVK